MNEYLKLYYIILRLFFFTILFILLNAVLCCAIPFFPTFSSDLFEAMLLLSHNVLDHHGHGVDPGDHHAQGHHVLDHKEETARERTQHNGSSQWLVSQRKKD